MRPPDPVALAERVAARDRGAVAAALNLLEDRRAPARARATALLSALPAGRLRAGGHLVGLTGPPGAGKSTLAAALIRAWREEGRRVGVLAVDPSSPLTGGALLGDRLRMLQPVPDDGVFIRSLASHGETGGLAVPVGPLTRVMLVAFDVVLVETVGVGQTEVDVAAHTDTTCLVVQPASGDTIQFLKAGIMEIPQVLAVNKADLGPLAERALVDLTLSLRRQGATGAAARGGGGAGAAGAGTGAGDPDADADEAGGEAAQAAEAAAEWEPPVVLVSATRQTGVRQLAEALQAHRAWLGQGGRLPAARRAQEVAWGLKRLREEFGRFGLERLGGERSLRGAWEDADEPAAEVLATLRERLLRELGAG
jgi:LAO/AO transport system kinase